MTAGTDSSREALFLFSTKRWVVGSGEDAWSRFIVGNSPASDDYTEGDKAGKQEGAAP